MSYGQKKRMRRLKMLKALKELFGIGLKNPNKHGLEGASTVPNQDFSQRVEQYSAPVEQTVQEPAAQESPKKQKKAPKMIHQLFLVVNYSCRDFH